MFTLKELETISLILDDFPEVLVIADEVYDLRVPHIRLSATPLFCVDRGQLEQDGVNLQRRQDVLLHRVAHRLGHRARTPAPTRRDHPKRGRLQRAHALPGGDGAQL
jgi:hypothetical protein